MSVSLFTAAKTPPPRPCLLQSSPTTTKPLLQVPSLNLSFSAPPSLVVGLQTRRNVAVAPCCSNKKMMSQGGAMKEQKWTHEGVIVESLPNGMFRVRLDNEDVILGYISGKIRKNFIRMLPGDKVQIEVSRYDSTRGRIIYRLRNNKDSSAGSS